jgi:glucose/arabinose dehydrogenase
VNSALRTTLISFAFGAAACSRGSVREVSTGQVALDSTTPPPATFACAADNGGIRLPSGFCASVFADSVPGARHMAIAPNGDVFVQIQGGRGGGGSGVVALRDADKDGRAEVVERFGVPGGTGIALYNGFLYADERTRIVRYPIAAGSLKPSGDAQVVVDGIPTGGHFARNFVIDGQGNLFVNMGSRTNACQAQDRVKEMPGVDPCTELETRAGIWRYDAKATGQQFSPNERWATGIRNAVGLTINPGDGKLYATQHGRDGLFQSWPQLYNAKQSADNPAEVLLQVEKGDDFGWPYCYWDVDRRKLVLAPEYGGVNDGAQGRCSSKKGPAAVFPGHWAPNVVFFYTGSQLPAKYRSGAFIAFHGSWNRAPEPQGGYNVVFQPMRNGASAGAYEVFADGFAGDSPQPNNARYRPTGIAQGTDGSLLISADQGGRIWKVVHGAR